jgi:hypothetical protein
VPLRLCQVVWRKSEGILMGVTARYRYAACRSSATSRALST